MLSDHNNGGHATPVCSFSSTISNGCIDATAREFLLKSRPTCWFFESLYAFNAFIFIICPMSCRLWEKTGFGVLLSRPMPTTIHHPPRCLSFLPSPYLTYSIPGNLRECKMYFLCLCHCSRSEAAGNVSPAKFEVRLLRQISQKLTYQITMVVPMISMNNWCM